MTAGDDELIQRLRREADRSDRSHDPASELPLADWVSVRGDGTYRGPDEVCSNPARRPLAVHGAYGFPVTEPIRCELKAGHEGAHMAGFARTRILRSWHAYSWPGIPDGAKGQPS